MTSNCSSFVSTQACIVQGVAAPDSGVLQQQQQVYQQLQTSQAHIVCSSSLDDDDVQIVGASQCHSAPMAATVFCGGSDLVTGTQQGSLPASVQTKPVQVVQPTLSHHQVPIVKPSGSATATLHPAGLQQRVVTAVAAAPGISVSSASASSAPSSSVVVGEAAATLSQPMLQQNFNILNFNYPSTLLQLPDGRLFLQQPSSAGPAIQFVKLPTAMTAASGKPQQHLIAASNATAVQVSSAAPTQAFISQTPSGAQQVHFLAAPMTQQQLHEQQQLQQQQLQYQQHQQQLQQQMQQQQLQQQQLQQQQKPTLEHLKRMLPGVKDVAEANGRIVLTTKQDRVISMKPEEFQMFYNLTVQVDELQKRTTKTPEVEEELRKLRQMQNDVIKQANKMHQVIEQQQKATADVSAASSQALAASGIDEADSFVLAEPKYGEMRVLVEYRVEGTRYQLRLTPSQKAQVDEAVVRLGGVVERERLLQRLLAKQQQQQLQQLHSSTFQSPMLTMSQQPQQQPILAQTSATAIVRGRPTAVVVTAMPQQQQQQQPQRQQSPAPQQALSPPPPPQPAAPPAPTRAQIRAGRIHRQIQVEHRTLLSRLRPDPFRNVDEATANLLRFHLFQDLDEGQLDDSEAGDAAGSTSFESLSRNAWSAMEARFRRLQAAILLTDLRARVLSPAEPELQLLSDQLAVSAARQQLEAERARPGGQVTPLVFDEVGCGRPASPKRVRLDNGENVDVDRGGLNLGDATGASLPGGEDGEEDEFEEVGREAASVINKSLAASIAGPTNGDVDGDAADYLDESTDNGNIEERLGDAALTSATAAGDDEASAAIASIL